MSSTDIRIDEDFELAVAEGRAFQTLYVRIDDSGTTESEVSAALADCRRAIAGSIEAQIAWARRLLHGQGVAQDREAALRWFRIAARTGDADALNMVGRCYELGWGVAEDCGEAAIWFRRAADKGHAWAEFNLASLYAQGRGIPVDQAKALALLVRSARRGNAKAMNMLGRFRETVARKPTSAALWYRWAAEGGCFRGQFHHARFFVAAGSIDDGIAWFRTSLTDAPLDFRADAVDLLRASQDPRLRALADEFEIGERGSAA